MVHDLLEWQLECAVLYYKFRQLQNRLALSSPDVMKSLCAFIVYGCS